MKIGQLTLLAALLCFSKAYIAPGYVDDWDEVQYQNYETIETYIPPAYPLEHVDVY